MRPRHLDFGSETTLALSAAGSRPVSPMRSASVRPSLVSMNGMNTASNERMPHSIAVTCAPSDPAPPGAHTAR
jgi:hypothetical protein